MPLPYQAQNVLSENNDDFSNCEFQFGNAGLLGLAKLAGMAGPFSSITPWELQDESTKASLIFAGGYGAMPLGNNHPDLLNFIDNFLKRNKELSLTQNYLSKWRGAFSANLISILSSVDSSHRDSRIFYSNSGAESIEAAIKFAKFYKNNAKYIINFSGGYHGKTYAPLSLTPIPHYQNPFKPLMPNIETVPFDDIEAFKTKIESLQPDQIIAVILEPIQGDAGVIKPSSSFLKEIDSICKQHNIILIADEVLSGIGRWGYWFTSIEYGHMSPDIITLAKPLSGGLVPIGITIVRNDIYSTMHSGLNAKIQSNTFGGGALAMAIALRCLELIDNQLLVKRAAALGEKAKQRLNQLVYNYPELFESIHVEGLLWGLHFKEVTIPKEETAGLPANQLVGIAALTGLHQAGVMGVTSLGTKPHVRLMPAFNMPEDIFDTLLERLERFAQKTESSKKLLRSAEKIIKNLATALK